MHAQVHLREIARTDAAHEDLLDGRHPLDIHRDRLDALRQVSGLPVHEFTKGDAQKEKAVDDDDRGGEKRRPCVGG